MAQLDENVLEHRDLKTVAPSQVPIMTGKDAEHRKEVFQER